MLTAEQSLSPNQRLKIIASSAQG